MPIMTMLVSLRFVSGDGHSPNASRAIITWPTISAGSRLRTRRCVPVWQNLQVSVQPTCEETHSVPRSSSGMWTVSASCPSTKRSSHFLVPSTEILEPGHVRPRDDEPLGELGAQRLRQAGHRVERGGAAM